jgi:hypothetical protein
MKEERNMESFKSRKVLIITSSGGGGLLQAAAAKEQEIKCKDPSALVMHRDVMKDWMWKWVGNVFVGLWNRAQIKGCVRSQSFFGKFSYIAEYFFWPHIFFWSLYTLFKEDVDQVIDTQVMGTSAIIKALRFFNRCRKKRVYLEKVLVDLPTKKATHFFCAIRSLSNRDRKYFKLITIAPMLEKGQTEEEFWRVNCNLTTSELRYEDYYVRQSFIKYQNLERKHEPMILKTRYRNLEEWELIEKTIRRGTPQFQKNDAEIEFLILPETLVCTILLGSQPANDATFNYVKKFIEIVKNKDCQDIFIHLFVFCANHQPQQLSLFKRVADFIYNWSDYPDSLTVIPMSFQGDDVIAPLFFRSDITCTRSGGQTAMELMSAGRGKIWVHSEAKKDNGILTNEELLQGIPGWESANASYLQHVKNAEIVTPETFEPLLTEVVKKFARQVSTYP